MVLKITFLGTAAAIPTASRNLPCVCMEYDGSILMFDVGEGTQSSFAKAGLGWNKKMSIFVTHLHGDHCLGLLGLIQTMSMQDRSRPLSIYGPDGTTEFITTNLRMLQFYPPFEMVIRDINQEAVQQKGYTVRSCRADHSIPALSYLFQEADRPGRFHPEEAKKLGIPEGPLWKELQEGHAIQLAGRTIHPGQVVGSGRPGVLVGYSGDTRPTHALERFYAGCDHLIFDSTFTEEHAERSKATGHSTAAGAARLARNAGVKHLILTHFSARYADCTSSLSEARQIHPNVTAAADLMSIRV